MIERIDGYERISGFKQVGDPLPGSGPVLACWVYNREIYAAQNNADATCVVTYKATPDGWQVSGA